MKASLLQSKSWEIFQTSLGETVFTQQTPDFAYLAIKKSTSVGNYLFVPYGPFATSKSGFKKAFSELKKLANREKCFFIRVEPQDLKALSPLKDLKAKKSHDLNPKDTWVVDLSCTREELLQKIPKRTRGYYNTHEKKGISLSVSHDPKDIKKLIKLQQSLAKRKNISTFSDDYLKAELAQPFASLYTAEFEKKCIAAILVFEYEDTAYYMQAASDPNYRKLAANGILVAKLLLDMQEKGLKSFDFWGIAPENAHKSHPWFGFTAFKRSFEGISVHYCGTHDIVLSKPLYGFYAALRAINRFRRKANFFKK